MELLIVLVVFIIIVILLYNSLISKVNQIQNAEGALDACLKQRYDLLPNLVEVAQQYMTHEENMFTKIIELRNKAQSATTLNEVMENNKELDKTLKSFMVNVENYPTLLSNHNFVKLQEALIDLENNISAARRFYNASVVAYNEAIQMIPGNLMAPLMGLRNREIYSISEVERINPSVKNLFKK